MFTVYIGLQDELLKFYFRHILCIFVPFYIIIFNILKIYLIVF